jgi:hypothetical protein
VYIIETEYEVADWFQCRALVNTEMNLQVPYKARNFLTS